MCAQGGVPSALSLPHNTVASVAQNNMLPPPHLPLVVFWCAFFRPLRDTHAHTRARARALPVVSALGIGNVNEWAARTVWMMKN